MSCIIYKYYKVLKQWLVFVLFIMGFPAFNTVNAQNINTPNKMGPLGTEVNTFSGNLYIPRMDFSIPGRGFDLSVAFFYNSFNFDQNLNFGNGWTFIYGIKYKNDTANSITLTWGNGRDDNYSLLGNATYKSPTGFFNTLSQYQPNKFLLTEKDGVKYYFDNNIHKRITRLEDPDGNFINFNYTDTLLTSMVNGAGQTVTFTYNAGNRLSSVLDATTTPNRTWNYNYDSYGNLTQVADPLGGLSKYSYLINGPMKALTDKNNNTVDIIYYSNFTISELIGCNKRQSFSYDSTTRITVVTDYMSTGSNQVTTYGYTTFGQQVWLTSLTSNCCGFNMTFQFDANGNKIKETDANGNNTSYTYDNRGNMLTIKDALNQVLTYTYSSDFNNVTSFTDAKGNVTIMLYNSTGNLVQLIEPGNLVYTATYNSNGDILSSTDPLGNTFTYTYDSNGNPTIINGPSGYHATLSTDVRGNLLTYGDSRGNTTAMEYDILNRLKKITDPINNNVKFTYDAEGNPIIMTNKNNEPSQLKFDASNRMVQFTDPLNHISTITYDGMDNITSVKNSLGNAATYSFDSRNRLVAEQDALNNTVSKSYDAKGNLLTEILPTGQHITYVYDILDRVSSMSDETGTIASFVYDKNDNVTSYTNGTGAVTTAVYDSLNRIKQITDPLGYSTSYVYDKNSNVTSTTDRNGFVKLMTYDSFDRLSTYTDNNGNTITITYDTEGNAVSMKDQNNNITSYSYDNLNRVNKITYPDGSFIQYTFNNKGNITVKRLTDGTNITYGYDTLNRIISKVLPGGQSFSYGYDAIGRVISAANSVGTVVINYDALNRITSESFDGRTTSYSYNIAGRTKTIVYPDSTTITKNYDLRNRLSSILKGNTIVANYQYNGANRVTTKVFANGVTTNLQYDIANRLINFTTANGAIQNSSFTYDKERNVKSINRQNAPSLSEQFTYDNGYRLTSYKRGTLGGVQTVQNSYSYDPVGNRISANLNGTSVSYSVNNLNQVVSSNNGQLVNFTYDNNGNLTYDGIFYKKYDAQGRLVTDSASSSNVLTFRYDAFGRRVQKVYSGTNLKYSYSGTSEIEERDGITGLLKNRTIFNSTLSPVENDFNNVAFYYHQNHLNSTEAISNGAGALLERYQYDVFGKQSIYDNSNTLLSTSLSGNRFGFTGQEYDSADGGIHFHYRNYNPQTGTFDQRDPIGYADAMGMYQYVDNNPANGIDIFGLAPCPPGTVTQETSDQVSKETNWVTILNYLSKFINKRDKEFFDRKSITDKSKLVGRLSISLQAVNLTIQINAYLEARSQLSGREQNIRVAEIESNLLYLSGDIASASPSAENPVSQAWIKATGLMGAIDAAVYEKTGSSIARHYSDLDLGAVNRGNKLLQQAEQRYIWDAKRIEAFTKLFGSDQSNWTDEMKETFELHQKASKTYTQTNVGVYNNVTPDCPPNNNNGGTQKKPPPGFVGPIAPVNILQSKDPNIIIGPDGVASKHWVSVNDRLPYTILYENDKTASAPAKFVRITSPVQSKQDASTFQLGTYGFNNQTFAVPPSTASYYQRLDCRDSLGLFVDVTAGYDQIGNQAFWEFQSIDPVTLLPPTNPLKGFLLLQDTVHANYGHAFVNFSMKPITTAVTLDTIGARGSIVFDTNDTIPTNIATNTIDAFPPTSHMVALPGASSNPVHLAWAGTDDPGGSGVKSYTLYASTDGVNFNIIRSGIVRTDTTITLAPNTNYCFFVLATDSVGNMETLRPGETRCTFVGAGPLPVTWLYFNGTNQDKTNILDWATGTEINTREFSLERSLDARNFTSIASITAAGNSTNNRYYEYKDLNIDQLNSSVMYYRVKQINFDGFFSYSNVVRLLYNQKALVSSLVYPNPTEGIINLVVGDRSLIGSNAFLVDENGRVLETIKITANSQSIQMTKYVNGVYFIRLKNKEVIKIIKI